MSTLITIANSGKDIVETNYFDTDHAKNGFVYLSCNAGDIRLLLPDEAANMLCEIDAATSVTIEPSISITGCIDIVFEDGTSSPFSITVSKQMIDRQLPSGTCTLSVWLRAGKYREFAASIV